MKGLISQVWSANASEDKFINTNVMPKYYDGKYPVNTVSTKTGTKTDIRNWQNFLNWWGNFGLDVDGVFASPRRSEVFTPDTLQVGGQRTLSGGGDAAAP